MISVQNSSLFLFQMSSLSQPKLPFPQRKKVSILKTTKDKVTNLLSNDKKTKNNVLLANEQILRVPSLGMYTQYVVQLCLPVSGNFSILVVDPWL